MAFSRSRQTNKVVVFILAVAFVTLALYLYISFSGPRLTAGAHANVLKIPVLILSALLAYLGVRALNTALFDFVFRIRRGYEAPTLVRNIFTLIVFTILFVVVFKWLYTDVNL